MGNYYSLEYANTWMGIKESAFRTNANGKDTANLASDSFRRFPIRWSGAIEPKSNRFNIQRLRSAGKGLDYSHTYRNGYIPIVFRISGDVIDFAFIYQLMGACTTAGSYTHTYITSTTPTTPTFQILQKVGNASTAEAKYNLFVGCKITEFVASWSENTGRITGTLTIECAQSIVGLALTTDPTWIATLPYYFNPTNGFAWTGYTGPHTYAGYCSAWTLRYKNGQSLRKIDYLNIPDRVIENFRTIALEFDWISEELDDFVDSQRDPTTDLDQDLVHTLSNGVDTMVMTWAKMAVELLSQKYDYKNFYLKRKYKATLNPNQTSTLQFVETNTADNSYYEG